MKRFKIRGTAHGTGAKVKPLIIEADSEREAVEEALSTGLQVTSVVELTAQEEADLPPGSVTRTATSSPTRHAPAMPTSRTGASAQLLAAVAPKPNTCRICGDKTLAMRKIPRLGYASACIGYVLVFASVAAGGFAGWQWYREMDSAGMNWVFGPWSIVTLVCMTWLLAGFLMTISKRIVHCQKCRAAFDAW
jgi:hypothetical protein